MESTGRRWGHWQLCSSVAALLSPEHRSDSTLCGPRRYSKDQMEEANFFLESLGQFIADFSLDTWEHRSGDSVTLLKALIVLTLAGDT